MRLLYVLNATAPRGGATKSFLALADTMAADGNEIAVIVPDENGITPALMERGWKVICMPFAYSALPPLSSGIRDIVKFIPRSLRALVINRKARKTAVAFAKDWKPDIVHDNTSVTDLGHCVAVTLGIPHIIHVREYGWEDFKMVILGLKKRLSWSKAYGVAITAALARFRGRNLPEGRMNTVYNGIVKEVSSTYISAKEPFFFYAGRILLSKGINDLADAYIAYASGEIRNGRRPLMLKLAGETGTDGFAETGKKKFADAGVEEYVEWLGSIDNVMEYYKKAAATVVPSYSEGFGRVMPEAISAGCLCVVRDSAGLAEQLQNGRHITGQEIALAFTTRDQLVSLLGEVSDAYRERSPYMEGGRFKDMIDAGRLTVSSLYTYDAYARSIGNIYFRAIQESKKH